MAQRKLNILGNTLLLVNDDNTLTSCRWLPDIIRENSGNSEISENSDYSDHSDILLREASSEINEYLCGERKSFDVPIEPRGTEFQMKVWDELRRIPYGETITYAELARRIGHPTACRAVANACGANPLPIIIPCHRVISSSGRPGGYTGPTGIKGTLILNEKLNSI